MIKAVIFDYGGVVIARDFSFCREVASIYNLPEELVAQKVKLPLELFHKGVTDENQFWDSFLSVFKKFTPVNRKKPEEKSSKGGFFIYPQIINLIRKLREQGIKTALLTNIIKPQAELVGKRGDFKDFDLVVLSCEEHLAKPDRKIYLLAAERLAVRPEECIFIDDQKENLKPARELGMKTVLAEKPEQVANDVARFLKF